MYSDDGPRKMQESTASYWFNLVSWWLESGVDLTSDETCRFFLTELDPQDMQVVSLDLYSD